MSSQRDPVSLDEDLPWMRRVARQMLGARLRRMHESQDLVQATLASVLEDLRRDEFQGTAHRRGFLRKALWNRARAMGRDEDRARLSDVDLDLRAGPGSSPSAAAQRGEEGRHLRGLLAQLPAGDLEVVRLVHVERRTYEQAAVTLGIRVDAVRKRYSRALERLRHLVGEERE